MKVTEKYPHDKKLEAPHVYKTEEEKHPGVAMVMKQGNFCLAGDIDAFSANYHPEFPEYRLTPKQNARRVRSQEVEHRGRVPNA